ATGKRLGMDALGLLGRVCRLGHFCRRSTATPPPPSPRPPPRSNSGRAVRAGARATSSSAPQAMGAKREEEPRVVTLRPVEATPESFAPFGQVIAASPDGDQFGPHDAQLDLSRGIPRFDSAHTSTNESSSSTLSWTRALSALAGSTS
uniref:Uncharacterized protein n=1 Tax=Aegilops tauschii subsp. strangulata TaxID=200361 RepID=A0A453FV79_AEGTS